MQKPRTLFWKLQCLTNALRHLHSNVSEKGNTRLHANNFFAKNGKIGIFIYAAFLDQSVRWFHRVSKALQKSELLLSTCAELYSSLVDLKRN